MCVVALLAAVLQHEPVEAALEQQLERHVPVIDVQHVLAGRIRLDRGRLRPAGEKRVVEPVEQVDIAQLGDGEAH